MKPIITFFSRILVIFSLILIGFFVLFIGIYSLISYINNIDWNYISDQNNISELINILILSFSGSAFFAILITIYYESKRRRNELQQITIDLFKEWRSPTFRAARLTASKHVRKKWHKAEYREEFYKSFIAIETSTKLKIPEKHIQAVSDIIGFYSVLSLYRGNQEDIKNLSYFYYGWWRKLLYDIAEYRDAERESIVESTNFLKQKGILLDRREYMNSVKLRSVLQRLDRLCMFSGVPSDYDLMRS